MVTHACTHVDTWLQVLRVVHCTVHRAARRDRLLLSSRESLCKRVFRSILNHVTLTLTVTVIEKVTVTAKVLSCSRHIAAAREP